MGRHEVDPGNSHPDDFTEELTDEELAEILGRIPMPDGVGLPDRAGGWAGPVYPAPGPRP